MNHDDDLKQFEKIIVHVDRDLEDIVPEFLENRQEDIKSIGEALTNGDFETIRIAGHSMKGSGGGYGFNKISLIGGALEIAAKNNNADEIETRLEELVSYLGHLEINYI